MNEVNESQNEWEELVKSVGQDEHDDLSDFFAGTTNRSPRQEGPVDFEPVEFEVPMEVSNETDSAEAGIQLETVDEPNLQTEIDLPGRDLESNQHETRQDSLVESTIDAMESEPVLDAGNVVAQSKGPEDDHWGDLASELGISVPSTSKQPMQEKQDLSEPSVSATSPSEASEPVPTDFVSEEKPVEVVPAPQTASVEVQDDDDEDGFGAGIIEDLFPAALTSGESKQEPKNETGLEEIFTPADPTPSLDAKPSDEDNDSDDDFFSGFAGFDQDDDDDSQEPELESVSELDEPPVAQEDDSSDDDYGSGEFIEFEVEDLTDDEEEPRRPKRKRSTRGRGERGKQDRREVEKEESAPASSGRSRSRKPVVEQEFFDSLPEDDEDALFAGFSDDSEDEDALELERDSSDGSSDSEPEESNSGRRKKRRGGRRRSREESVDAESDSDERMDDDEESNSDRGAKKAIPTWNEAIDVLVDVNVQARSKSSGSKSGRSRSRSGGSRGGSGKASGGSSGQRSPGRRRRRN